MEQLSGEEPSMRNEVDVNKISEKQERRAEHIEGRLRHQGVGREEAEKQAYQEVAGEQNTGGGNSAGDAPKHASQQRDHRTGSESNGS
jgi:hypothetical protein